MSEAYIGEIRIFAGNFAPYGWALCNGDLMRIQQYTALFSILGTTYGGDGRTTFALPDLRGRAPMHFGTGQGLTPRTLGEKSGSSTVTLLTNQMPTHTHTAVAFQGEGSQTSPTNNVWAAAIGQGFAGDQPPLYLQSSNTSMNPSALTVSGGSSPHNNMQPYVGLNFIICLNGIYPPKN